MQKDKAENNKNMRETTTGGLNEKGLVIPVKGHFSPDLSCKRGPLLFISLLHHITSLWMYSIDLRENKRGLSSHFIHDATKVSFYALWMKYLWVGERLGIALPIIF